LESTIWLDDGFVVITGEVGSGKTTILQSFINELKEDTVCAVISQTQLTPTEFLEATLHEFGYEPFGKKKVELLVMINNFLTEQHANGKKVVLIVDEAQNLDWRVLEEVRLLSSVESHKGKLVHIILSGQPELKLVLQSPQLKQLMQRVRCKFHLNPLPEAEVSEYILHRLGVAGNLRKTIIKPEAYEAIYRYTGGVPRMINMLCDTALLFAFADDKSFVDNHDVLAAATELNWQEAAKTTDAANVHYLNQRLGSGLRTGDSAVRIDLRENGAHIRELYFPIGRIVIGRSEKSDIRLPSRYISLQHVEIICSETGCIVRDLNSTNGLMVKGDQVKEYRLKNKDVLTMAGYELILTYLREDDESPHDKNGEPKEGGDTSSHKTLESDDTSPHKTLA
jgi:type II secretory pathway predicted ATPase ExeA/pSer/pThr/pTyr-binding forkhead associated (FHA) protein